MNRKAISAVIVLYAAFIIGTVGYQFLSYRRSFEGISPYSHLTAPTGAEPAAQPTVPAAATAETSPSTAPSGTAPCPTTECPDPTEPSAAALLDLNAATFEELCALPEIGESLAQAILDYRTQNGGFRNREQLREVPGIGEQRFRTIAPLVFIVNEQPLPPSTEPTEKPAPAVSETNAPAKPSVTFPIDLNAATFEELCALPDIGESLAQAILDYRTQNGGFRYREQLCEVPGIGEQRFRTIASMVYVVNEQPPTEPPTAPPTEAPTPLCIDLNTATHDDLLRLPGCDDTIADAILHLREQIHGFSNPLELVMAEEVSDQLYLSWRDYLTVSNPPETQP